MCGGYTGEHEDRPDYQVHDYNIEPATVGDSLNQKGERWNWFTEVDGKYVKTPTPNDPVASPAHYTSGEIECIDAMREAFGDEGLKAFCKLNAFKYLWRSGKKGSEKEDIEKAIWYLRKSIGDDPRD